MGNGKKKYGYVYYSEDFRGSDRENLIQYDDWFSVHSILCTIRLCRSEDLLGGLCGLGKQVPVSEYIDAIADCQRGNTKFWVNVHLTDTGVQVSFSGKEPEVEYDDLPDDLQEFVEFLGGDMSPVFSDTDELPF